MARRLPDPNRYDAEQLPIARSILADPEKAHSSQVWWARLFITRYEAEAAERVGQPQFDADGLQG
ncbi:MAG: hypothetical protein IPM24_03920 [Bryobacterales bacterium]|nr:hypothetical protein [Bryobacterales bacterium]